MHGIGVKTPLAAAVEEATCGFACVLHIPKGAMFKNGKRFCTVAALIPASSTVAEGMSASVLAESPSLHRI
jgi:hypothetical protein